MTELETLKSQVDTLTRKLEETISLVKNSPEYKKEQEKLEQKRHEEHLAAKYRNASNRIKDFCKTHDIFYNGKVYKISYFADLTRSKGGNPKWVGYLYYTNDAGEDVKIVSASKSYSRIGSALYKWDNLDVLYSRLISKMIALPETMTIKSI